jgi:competence protein ComEC
LLLEISPAPAYYHHVREPLLLPFLAVSTGILLTRYVPFSTPELLCIAAAYTLLALLAPTRSLKWMAALLALTATGSLTALLHTPPPPPELDTADGSPVTLSGCVVEPAIIARGRESFTLELAPGARTRVNWYLRPGETAPEVHYGQLVEFPAKTRAPHNFQNPGAFDYVHFLARQHIFWTASTPTGAQLTTLPGRCGNGFWAAIFALRTGALTRIERLYEGQPYTIAMMEAILIGETAGLEKLWTEDYRATGTFHALVISGSHVAVLAATFLFLLRIGFVPQNYATLLTIGMAWLYCLITGWQAPVIRSAAALTLFAIGRLFYRESRMLNILAAVGLAFLLLDPESLYDPSAQLSFLSVALIAAFVVPVIQHSSTPIAASLSSLPSTALTPKAAHYRVEFTLLTRTLHTLLPSLPARAAELLVHIPVRFALFFYELLLTSALIQIGLAVPMIVYFHRLSATGLSANAAAVPLLGLVVPIGFISVILNSTLFATIASFFLTLTERIVAFHARWEPLYRIPDPPLWLALIFVICLAIAATRLPQRVRFAAFAASLVALAVLVAHPFPAISQPGALEVTTIDVGQGDSVLLAFPDGKLVLMDTGGIPTFGKSPETATRIDIGEDVVAPYLWSRGIRHIDAVAISHFHDDHSGGLASILKDFSVTELWTGAVPASYLLPQIPVRKLLPGVPFPFGGAAIQVLSPSPNYTPRKTPHNNDSLVLRLTYGRHSFLLTGDAEKPIEAQLLNLPRTDVLKVGHHGSKTSSTPAFLDALHPAFALISDGFRNSYGHPHPNTLAALTERHIAISRTDLQGLTTVRSDGRYLTIFPAPLPFRPQAPHPGPPISLSQAFPERPLPGFSEPAPETPARAASKSPLTARQSRSIPALPEQPSPPFPRHGSAN